MKVAFLLSGSMQYLCQYKKELTSLSFINTCDFFVDDASGILIRNINYDVVFYDTLFDPAAGRRLYRKYKSSNASCRVILMTREHVGSLFRKISQHGINGIVEINGDPETVKLAVISVLKNYFVHDMPMAKSLPSTVSYALLTERERQILRLFVNGFSYKEVGYKLDVKLDTVRSHIRNIYKKLNVRSKTEAVMKVIETSLIDA